MQIVNFMCMSEKVDKLIESITPVASISPVEKAVLELATRINAMKPMIAE